MDWFSKNNSPFEWTGFLAKLKHKCWLYGIELIVETMKAKECKEAQG